MHSPRNIVLIGTGWLGRPLLQRWMHNGDHCTVFTSSSERESALATFKAKVINAPLTDWRRHALPENTHVVVTWPPMSQDINGLNLHRTLAQTIATWNPKHVWLTSSISVYGDPPAMIDEQTEAAAGASAAVEAAYAELPQLTVVRLGGLFGPNRHPGKFLAGKANVAKPLAPVNMLHLSDAVHAIDFLMDQPLPLAVYNIVHPDHPTREEFYQKATTAGTFAPVHFDAADQSAGKIVSSARLLGAGFHFQFHDLSSYLEEL